MYGQAVMSNKAFRERFAGGHPLVQQYKAPTMARINSVACPKCLAPAGKLCVYVYRKSPDAAGVSYYKGRVGQPMHRPHAERIDRSKHPVEEPMPGPQIPDDLTKALSPIQHLAVADSLLQQGLRAADSGNLTTQEAAVRKAERATAHALTAIGMMLRTQHEERSQ